MRAGRRVLAAGAGLVVLTGLVSVGLRVVLPAPAVAADPAGPRTASFPMPSPDYTVAPSLALHVAGNQLVDVGGQAVTLHGADMSGTEFVCVQGWSHDPFGGQPEDSPATFAAMRAWGINSVRIPLNEDCWLGINSPTIGGAAYRTPIIHLVRDLEQDGFRVILDLHWSAPGTALSEEQQPAPDLSHAPSFWNSVAHTFSGDGGVLFDLFNEPNLAGNTQGGVDPWTCLWHGCTITNYSGSGSRTISKDWQSAGFDQLTQVVREAGAANVIMAGCLSWAGDCRGWSRQSGDPDTVVSWHAYPGAAGLGNEENYWSSTIAPLARQVPVIIGETGDNASPPTPFLNALLPFVAQHSLSVLAWAWNGWGNPTDDLVTGMQSGTPTSGEGSTYRTWLQGLG